MFLRLSGNADGFIVNEVLGDDDDLRLRFSFALQLVDAPSDSAKEREFREVMERDYLKAVDATLGAIRKMASRAAAAQRRSKSCSTGSRTCMRTSMRCASTSSSPA